MRSILFVENREKTEFWAEIARVLIRRGIAVHWIVQNKAFTPHHAGQVHQLGYPRRSDLRDDVNFEDFPAVITDRGRQHFNNGAAHYPYYQRRCREVVEAIRPDALVGESTLMHELFAIEAANRLNIPYLHPTVERYPEDRIAMLLGETQLAVGGDAHPMPEDRLIEIAEAISTGRSIPSYMHAPSPWQRRFKRLHWALTRGRVFVARLAGERFNTPTMRRKLQLARNIARNRKRWDALARAPEAGARAILYPLQLQPEASIDVWGRPYSDQVEVIARILEAAPDDIYVAVKGNPKERSEISDALIDFAAREPRVILLPRDMRMPQAHAITLGAVTICGTVGIEAVFGRGRCISVRHPILDELFPEFAAPTPESAVARLLNEPDAGVGSVTRGLEYLRAIVTRSWPGFVSDPFSSPRCMEPQNIERVAHAIVDGWRQWQREKKGDVAA